jgi:hypothetical protein
MHGIAVASLIDLDFVDLTYDFLIDLIHLVFDYCVLAKEDFVVPKNAMDVYSLLVDQRKSLIDLDFVVLAFVDFEILMSYIDLENDFAVVEIDYYNEN